MESSEAVKRYRASAKGKATYAAWYAKNKEKQKVQSKVWKAANPDKVIASRRKCLRKLYGANNPTGETKVGPCEICEVVKKLYYDHDHVTGEHRGWLCNQCNMRLGWFERLMKTGMYLKFSQYLSKTRGSLVTIN